MVARQSLVVLLFFAACAIQTEATLRRGKNAKKAEVKRKLATGSKEEMFKEDTGFWSRFVQEVADSVATPDPTPAPTRSPTPAPTPPPVLCSGEVRLTSDD